MRKFQYLCYSVLFFSTHLYAQKIGNAHWISLPDRSETNTWLCYHKTAAIQAMPKIAMLQIATDSKYWLYINGKLVVREGQLKRGPNLTDTYYDELDIAPFLKSGQNTFNILTWYWGKQGFAHNSSGQIALFFQCKAIRTFSDESWQILKHPAFYNPSGIQPNFRLAETNVGFDARNDIDWINANNVSWKKGTSVSEPSAAPWYNLIKRPVPFWKDYGLKNFTSQQIQNGDKDTFVCRLPYNAQVTPYFKINALPGIQIDILTDNYLVAGKESLASVRTEYITKEGIQSFECPNWMNGHFVKYIFPKGINVIELKYRETGYGTEFKGSFKSDDKFLNTLWKKSQRTLYLNMRDNYFDCPDRERAQWWGDVVIEIGQSFYALDTLANQLSRKAIHELIDWQQPDGTLSSPIPAGNWGKELPVQMLAAIYGIDNYFQYTGDTSLIKNIYPKIKKYLSLYKLGQDSLVIHRSGGWDWADWGNNIDVPLLDNAWYVLALQSAAKMATIAGDDFTAKEMKEKCSSIKKSFNQKFWRETYYRSPDYTAKTDERGNALAILAGIAEIEKFAAIKKILDTSFHASPYMEKYVLESLLLMKETEAALQRIKVRYSKMVHDSTTTLWELFDKEEESSNNHAWTGGPLTLLCQYVAGVAPDKPGYEQYHILPQMGRLRNISFNHQTIKGSLKVDIHDRSDEFTLQVHTLSNATAIVGLPCNTVNDFKTVHINKKLVWSDGVFTPKNKAVKYLGFKDGYLQFTIPGKGIYLIEARK